MLHLHYPDDEMSATAATTNDDEDPQWIELTETKQFSRLLYTNPVCFLSTVSQDGGKRNVMAISWLTATSNEGTFMCSMNRRRHSASVILSGVTEFVLSVPVQGMETLVLDVGGISGQWGSKFPEDHAGQELPKELQASGEETSKRKAKKRRKLVMSAMGIPALETVPFGSQTPKGDDRNGAPSQTNAFAIRGTVAHLKCTIYKLLQDAIDENHLLILARVTAACVHPSYWDSSKNGFRPEKDAPPYLTFFGSQEFGYVVTQPTDQYENEENTRS